MSEASLAVRDVATESVVQLRKLVSVKVYNQQVEQICAILEKLDKWVITTYSYHYIPVFYVAILLHVT